MWWKWDEDLEMFIQGRIMFWKWYNETGNEMTWDEVSFDDIWRIIFSLRLHKMSLDTIKLGILYIHTKWDDMR